MARKKGIEVRVGPVICVEIIGREANGKGTLPRAPEDDGLVSEFLMWMLDNHIFGTVRAGYSGGGGYLGFFSPEQLEPIKEWFQTKGFDLNDR